MCYGLWRRLLFCLSPEKSHAVALICLRFFYRPWLVKLSRRRMPKHPVSLFGLEFPNRIGLAAGLDKNGDYIDALFGLGFGFIEVGALTPRAQPGNPPPRLFRLPAAKALINRLGFNNKGVDYAVQRLKKRKVAGIVGVNLGKNLSTPLDKAVEDYCFCFEKVYPYADYLTVNISSPNTPKLRELHTEFHLHGLLKQLKATQQRLQGEYQRHVPLLLKISPDLLATEVEEVAHIALNHQIEGLVAVNTTFNRQAVKDLPQADEEGGLSGQPLLPLTLRTVSGLYSIVGDRIPIIAVGGIMCGDDAAALFAAGASLLQVYTGLIYQGPALLRSIA